LMSDALSFQTHFAGPGGRIVAWAVVGLVRREI
jgi:hypothetical protein